MPTYPNMVQGRFLFRPNRFIAHVEIGGREEVCHVKNTGRCRELLVPDAAVWCQKHDNPNRKTKYSLISVQKGRRCINMDSQIPNKVAFQWLAKGGLGFVPTVLQTEKFYGASRFDFYLETEDGHKGFVEVKGVTLEREDAAYFPDAPTERGTKHLRELAAAAREGYFACVLFVVQMEEIAFVAPNEETDPAFAAALRQAENEGVLVRAVGCRITPDTIEPDAEIPVKR